MRETVNKTILRERAYSREYNKRKPLAKKAHNRVWTAIWRGDIPRADTLTCTDCGAPAHCYDHRDYSKPLEVEPVCIGCNRRRGPGAPYDRA